jgi:hypothetical protein
MSAGPADDGHTLEVENPDEGQPRHLLDGRPVDSGAEIEVQLADGGWLPGRYESRAAESDIQAWIYIPLRLGGDEPESGRNLEAPLPRGARCRWPA